ncbi:unnamed protein product [Trichobilharzia regenti]|nr:unnamed protein product [Trichobilharzia regenti]
MIPLYRQYWLVLSIPCILIEDCPCVDKNPYYTHATIRNRQIAYAFPDLAKRMGLYSSEEAGKHLREAINSVKDSEFIDREELTYRVVAALPNPSVSSATGLPIEQLRALVKPERVSTQDSSLHNTCPAVRQLAKLRCSTVKQSTPQTLWSILLPDGYKEVYKQKLLHDNNDNIKKQQAVNPISSPVESSLPPTMDGSLSTATTVKKSEDCPTTTITTTDSSGSESKEHTTTTTTLNNDNHRNDNLSAEKNQYNMLIEQAKWTIDCLEASLNPRGVRESRLRKTIGQLRPLLIKVIAMCPPELIYPMIKMDAPQSPPVPTTHNNNTVSQEMFSSARNNTESITQSIMCSWLETALVGIGYRLGRLDLIKRLLFNESCKSKKESIENKTKTTEQSDEQLCTEVLVDNIKLTCYLNVCK